MNKRFKFGLVGKDISYSFSKKYFINKFKILNLEKYKYYNFDIPEIEEFPFLLYHREHEFRGLNVTIPYKETIVKYLDKLHKEAAEIGAVNTIKITSNNMLVGYNTDVFGFQKSLKPLLKKHHKNALILGTGGASKAVAYALQKMDISYKFVSRKAFENSILYNHLNQEIITQHTVIVNCTPLGTHPNTAQFPNIPYQYLGENHLLYDLIYNPEKTQFLQKGAQQGAAIKNGLEMLTLQAEKSWEIWNS